MPPAPDPVPGGPTLHLVLAADPVSVRNGLARMTSAPPLTQLSPDHRATVELILAEVLNNVTEHAYAGSPGDVAVTLQMTAAGLACQVVDKGHAMPGGLLPEGNLPVADLPEGGFGWHLVRSLTQDMHYHRVAGQNRLGFVIPVEGTTPR